MNHWRNRVFYKLGLMFDPVIMVNNSRNSKCFSRGYHEWVWDEIRCYLPQNIKCRQCSTVAIFNPADLDKVDEFFKEYFGC